MFSSQLHIAFVICLVCFKGLWLAALSYANPYIFHYFLQDFIFDLRPLFQEHNYGVKQGLGVMSKHLKQVQDV
jgi:hypothetical protein